MQTFAYFDTDVFHRIGQTFATQGLANDLRDRVLLSPITVLEALSHLTLKKNEDVLAHIHAIHNWVNPKHAGLLPWPDVFIARIGYGLELKQDDFMDRLEKTINLCLSTDSPDEFRQSADKLKNEMDRVKDSAALQFDKLVEMNRKQPLVGEKFSEIWVHGTAQRVKANSDSVPVAKVVESLSAYHDFEEDRLLVATKNPQYKPDRNDILDAEQLVYLGDSGLQFVTCDGGYSARIKKSPQAAQIHKVALEDLNSVDRVEAMLRRITAQSNRAAGGSMRP